MRAPKRLHCGNCGATAGTVKAGDDGPVLEFRGRPAGGNGWDTHPVALADLPISWHCPRCRWQLTLDAMPRRPRSPVPAAPSTRR